jgi:hypothetical protein
MWNASVPGLRHNWPTERNTGEKAGPPARRPRLEHSALEMRLWTCTRRCANAGSAGATAESFVEGTRLRVQRRGPRESRGNLGCRAEARGII